MNAKCQSSNAKGGREPEAGGLRVEAIDEMPKFKIQMTNDGVRATSTDTNLTDTDTKHEHESQCQSSKLGIPGNPEKRTLSEGEFERQTGKRVDLQSSFRYSPGDARGLWRQGIRKQYGL